MNYARIIGTGSHLPERVLSNADLEKMVDTSDEWIVTRTGIRERHIAANGEGVVDLALQAATHALQAAEVAADSIDLIIFATTTPDRVFPSSACLLQQKLGATQCAAFDIQAVCTGFLYALGTAEKFIRSGSHKRALVIGAEVFSRLVDWNDRGTCVLFGDGAGAVVLEASEEPGIYSSHLYADGQYSNSLTVNSYVAQGQLQGESQFTRMQGGEVFKAAVNNMASSALEALRSNEFNASDLDWVIPHQANTRIIQAVSKKLKLPQEKVISTVAMHGNTSAASVPLALDTAVRDGRVQPEQHLLLTAMGGGFTWGSALLRF
ncbi:beta-ketoacyl-ACP synthase III [Candidatus Venteria ishoeyi]|uniref:Beta-ketoacyl-[acyl-carrier-protein] synthase III n=1 Tax=Candidatus Venteria ishoeyi TaxID=1899563 RepID=A0A1H6F9G2_9GAMM|nr:beta-ketoacyl-ACP synthase III [Candidatus Venteria ishoeyi]SEH05654.1 3-oxoacyl-[acyl-carrier-protein] synthase 3 [Candidatus Venteria ishoeyi]